MSDTPTGAPERRAETKAEKRGSDADGPRARSACHTIVIFGASGDLTARKLVPSLYRLRQKERLPSPFKIVGTARTEWDDEAFRAELRSRVADLADVDTDTDAWRAFERDISYFPGDMTEPAHYERLGEHLSGIESDDARGGRLYYLATAPEFFPVGAEGLAAAGLTEERTGPKRVVIEKPFGRDLASSSALSDALHRVLSEDQIYRIDHYLGKETVQNLMVVRFANAIFEPLWNRNYIDNVQITVAESVGAGHRAGYYDRSGVLRDMVQNHLLQLLTLVALEPPARFAPDSLRNEKVKVLDAVRPFRAKDARRHTVRGQYAGYTEEDGVDPQSATATFAAIRLHIDNWRWQGVPFYLRTGKALAKRESEITIQFRCPPHGLFDTERDCRLHANLLTIRVQPEEGIDLRFETKAPDRGFEMVSKEMAFSYREAFEDVAIPDAYERLLLDAVNGDASLFTRDDEIARAWGIVDGIAAAWSSDEAPPLARYERGSWGPCEADALLGETATVWHQSPASFGACRPPSSEPANDTARAGDGGGR